MPAQMDPPAHARSLLEMRVGSCQQLAPLRGLRVWSQSNGRGRERDHKDPSYWMSLGVQ